MIDDPWFYAAAIPAVLITGISKGAFGIGLGIMAVPLLALTVPVPVAAGVMLPILCLMDIFAVWAYRRSWHRGLIVLLVPAAIVGMGIGTLTFRHLDEYVIRLMLGTIALSFTLHHWLGGRRFGGQRAGGPAALKPPSKAVGVLAGTVSGFTSFVAHAGGAPLSFYLLPQRLDKSVYAGTATVFFALVNYIKLVPYAWLGQLSPANLTTALLLFPLAPLSIWLGVRLHALLPPALFYRAAYLLVFLAGLKLVWDGASALGSG